jgi:hypothetical protein
VYAYGHADAKELQRTYEKTRNTDAKMVSYVCVSRAREGEDGKEKSENSQAHYGLEFTPRKIDLR